MVTKLRAALMCTVLGATVLASGSASATGHQVVEKQRVAMVRVTVRNADGTVVRSRLQSIVFGETGSISVETAGHDHELSVTPSADEALSVRVGYRRDGDRIGPTKSLVVESRRAATVHNGDDARVSVTVIPTRVSIAVGD